MTQPIHPVLERVARAMATANYPRASASDIDEMWDAWLLEARAAIQALLEPDEGMVEAACHDDVWEELEDTLTVDVSRRVYTAMLKPLLGDEG